MCVCFPLLGQVHLPVEAIMLAIDGTFSAAGTTAIHTLPPPKPNSRPAALATPCAALRFFCITFYTHTHHPSPPVPRNAVITNRAALPRSVLRFPPTFNAYLSIIDDAERPCAGLARVPCRRPSCCLVTGSGVQMGRLQWRNRRGVPIEALQS